MAAKDEAHIQRDKIITSNTKRIEALEALASPADVTKMTIKQLKEYAEENVIDLGEATVKADILALVQAG